MLSHQDLIKTGAALKSHRGVQRSIILVILRRAECIQDDVV